MVKKRFEALDAFRGICALSVAIFHMHVIGSVTEIDFFRGSAVFVEFFFVLSGFVLAHGYGFKDNLNFGKFMKARFFRLYPLHFSMFLVFLILEFGKLLAYNYGGISFNNAPFTNDFAISEIIPNLLLIQSWVSFASLESFNYPSWSISVEFYIYAILFATIVIFKGNRTISWLALSVIAFMLIASNSSILSSGVLEGLSCFFGGAVTYVIYKKLSHIAPSYIVGSAIEVGLVAAVVVVVQSNFEYRELIAPALFFVTVLFFAYEAGFISSLLKTKPFQYVGTLSYSIYMIHAAIIFCFVSSAMVLQKLTGVEMAPMLDGVRFLDFGGNLANNMLFLFMLALIVLASGLTYKHIEIPGQKLNRGKSNRSREKRLYD